VYLTKFAPEVAMTIAIRTRVAADAEWYDAVHAQILKRSDGHAEGLLVHVGLATADGFEILEVWESAAACEHYNQTVVAPLVAELSAGHVGEQPEMTTEELEPRGLVLPRAPVVF
jgi:quinol monooxygenase YgiN